MRKDGVWMSPFEIIMQYNPYEEEGVTIESINKQIDFVWDDFTIDNYNFLVLSYKHKPAYMQLKIDQEAFYVVEVLDNGKLYELKLDERDTVKALFKGYFLEYTLDMTPFKQITHIVH